MDDEYLAHYGVLGMKWGVRHDPQKAYARASKKFNKLAAKSDKYTEKAAKYNRRSRYSLSDNWSSKNHQKAAHYFTKAERNTKKASRWMQQMRKEFKKQNLIAIDPALIAKGDLLMERYKTMGLRGI